jgi:hypothetical protein
MRLRVTTATTASADRELLSNRIEVARHILTTCRKVNAWPSPRIMRTFLFILVNPIRPCVVKSSGFGPFLSSGSYCIAVTLLRYRSFIADEEAEILVFKGFSERRESGSDAPGGVLPALCFRECEVIYADSKKNPTAYRGRRSLGIETALDDGSVLAGTSTVFSTRSRSSRGRIVRTRSGAVSWANLRV